MTREEMKARAVELRSEGVLVVEIATYLGVSKATIVRWTNPTAAAKSKASSQAYKDGHRAHVRAYDRARRLTLREPCACGVLREPESEMCRGCRLAVAEVRRTLTEGMWADGWKRGDINAVLGLSPTSAYIYVHRAQAGWDLPHRRSPEALANIRAGNVRLQAA